jgi:hypothetical protein
MNEFAYEEHYIYGELKECIYGNSQKALSTITTDYNLLYAYCIIHKDMPGLGWWDLSEVMLMTIIYHLM